MILKARAWPCWHHVHVWQGKGLGQYLSLGRLCSYVSDTKIHLSCRPLMKCYSACLQLGVICLTASYAGAHCHTNIVTIGTVLHYLASTSIFVMWSTWCRHRVSRRQSSDVRNHLSGIPRQLSSAAMYASHFQSPTALSMRWRRLGTAHDKITILLVGCMANLLNVPHRHAAWR